MEKIVNYFGKWYIISEDTTGIELKELDENRAYTITDKNENARTIKQNSSLHLWFRMYADALNDAGLSLQEVVANFKKADIEWTMESFKEVVWRNMQVALTGKKSSKALTKDELQKVVKNVSYYMDERIGVKPIGFPSEDEIIFKQIYKGGQNG